MSEVSFLPECRDEVRPETEGRGRNYIEGHGQKRLY